MVTNRFKFLGRTIKKAQRNHKWEALSTVMIAPEIQLFSFLEIGSMMGDNIGRVIKSNTRVEPSCMKNLPYSFVVRVTITSETKKIVYQFDRFIYAFDIP